MKGKGGWCENTMWVFQACWAGCYATNRVQFPLRRLSRSISVDARSLSVDCVNCIDNMQCNIRVSLALERALTMGVVSLEMGVPGASMLLNGAIPYRVRWLSCGLNGYYAICREKSIYSLCIDWLLSQGLIDYVVREGPIGLIGGIGAPAHWRICFTSSMLRVRLP